MEFLRNLHNMQIYALLCLIMGKFIGGLAIIATMIAIITQSTSTLPIILGSLWGLLVAVSIFLCIFHYVHFERKQEWPTSPTAEAGDLKSPQSEFEPQVGH